MNESKKEKKPDPVALEMGARLKKYRTAKQWTQSKLAKECGDAGPGSTAISNYEKGRRRIRYEYAVIFGDLFGLPAAYFVCDVSEAEAKVIIAMRSEVAGV